MGYSGILGVVVELQNALTSGEREKFDKKFGERIGSNAEGILAYYISEYDEVTSDEQLDEFMLRVANGIETEEGERLPIVLTGKPQPSDWSKLSAALKKFKSAPVEETAHGFFAVWYDTVDNPLYELTRVDFLNCFEEDGESD
jgi:hypothetical protein